MDVRQLRNHRIFFGLTANIYDDKTSMIANMSRESILDDWLKSVLKTTGFVRVSLAGDASFRRYYRVTVEGSSYVVMDAPPPESPQLFIEIAQVLDKQGLKVPKVIAAEITQGFLLLTDLGDRLYLN